MRKKVSVAVLTSGGDAPGMNAAVRAIVRGGLYFNADIYAVYDGYQGLVDGNIAYMDWESVAGILNRGGTIIGTARCKEFREYSGLRKAAKNLVSRNINRLIVIGGDGSLSGADELRANWPALMEDLKNSGELPEGFDHTFELKIVGAVGSIDNDMADTDMTIGADSALHRIVEAVDALKSTAFSHRRTFVVEVMGRNCGYLALMAALATGAAMTFIPEAPPPDGWEEKICSLIEKGAAAGRRDNIIIVAEGAKNLAGEPITSAQVKEVIEKGCNLEARVTILGHVQRGGSPSAFDRYMSTVFGFAAVREAVCCKLGNEACMVALHGNKLDVVPLMKAVERTRAAANAIKEKNFELAAKLRGSDWQELTEIFRTLSRVRAADELPAKHKRFGLVVCGQAPGVNSAIRTAVRTAIAAGHEMIGFENGLHGVINKTYRTFNWMSVEDWDCDGGSNIGASREIPKDSDYEKIAGAFSDLKLDGILVIGGWNGYVNARKMIEFRDRYAAFNIPIICIPATINNNIPGHDLSIGCDTALNTISNALDQIKESTDNCRRVFAVEIMGGYCGFLAMFSGLGAGAEFIYTHERGVNLHKLIRDLDIVDKDLREHNRRTALILNNEYANPTYSTDVICSIFNEEGKGFFDARKVVLGPMQQGGVPSPADRIMAIRLSNFAVNELIRLAKNRRSDECGFVGRSNGVTKLYRWSEFLDMADFEARRPDTQWWMILERMIKALAIRPESLDRNDATVK